MDNARKTRWQAQEQFMAAEGATYAVLWVRKGENFVVAKDFTTEERRNATRIVRRDNKTFASEVRLLQIHVDGRGPVATAARSLQPQIVSAQAANMIPPPTVEALTTRNLPVRSDLAEEFSVKNIHFIPLTNGSKLLSVFGSGMYETASFKRWASASAGGMADTRQWAGAGAVLEYGVPTEPEVLSVKLLSLLIQELALVKTLGAFMLLSLEILSTLRVIIFVEGPSELMAGVRKSALAVVEGTMAADKKFAAMASAGGNSTKHYEYSLFRITKFFLKPVVVVIAWMTYVVEGYNEWQERRRLARIRVEEEGTARKDGTGTFLRQGKD